MILFKPKHVNVHEQSTFSYGSHRVPVTGSRNSPKNNPKLNDSGDYHDPIDTFKNPKQNIKNILTSPEQITEDDGWYIFSQIKHWKFFVQFLKGNEEKEDLEPIISLCKSLKYSKYNAGTILIRQGEESDGKVYIVMTGEVTVVAKNATVLREGGINVFKELYNNSPREEEAKASEKANSEKDVESPLVMSDQKNGEGESLERKNSGFSPNHSNPKGNTPDKKLRRQNSITKITRDRGNSNPSNANQQRADSPSRFKSLASSSRKGSMKDLKGVNSKDMILIDGKNSFAIATKNEFGIVKDIIGEGGYFGDKSKKRIRRRATIIANTDVELLSFSEEQLQVLHKKYTVTKQQFINFLRESFNMKDELETEVLMDTLEIFQVSRTDKITTQGSLGDRLYIIYEGECEVFKEVVYDDTSQVTNKVGDLNVHYRMKKTQKDQIPVGNISSGTFIGIESFYNDTGHYEFTAKVSSRRAILLGFKKDKVLFRFSKNTFLYMNEKHKPVYQNHLETLKYRLEMKGCRLDLLELTKVLPFVRRYPISSNHSHKFSLPIQIPVSINDSHEEISLHDHLSMIKSAYPSSRRESYSPKESPDHASNIQYRKNESKFDDSLLPELAAIMMRSAGSRPMYNSPPREDDFKSARKYELERAAYEKAQLQAQKEYLDKTLKRAAAILNNTSKKPSLRTVPPELRISSTRDDNKLDLDPEKFHNFGKQLNSYLDRVQEHYSGISKVIQDPNYNNQIPNFKFGFSGPEHLERLHQFKLGEVKNNYGKKKEFLLSARNSIIDPTVSNLIPKSPSTKQLESPKGMESHKHLSPSREYQEPNPLFYNDYPDPSINPVLKSLKTFLDTLRSPKKKESKMMPMKATVGGFLFDWKAKKRLRQADRSSHDLSQNNTSRHQNHFQTINHLHSFKGSSMPNSPIRNQHVIKKGSTVTRKKVFDNFGVINMQLGKIPSTGNLKL